MKNYKVVRVKDLEALVNLLNKPPHHTLAWHLHSWQFADDGVVAILSRIDG